MNQHTRRAKEWLDKRYSRDASGGYRAHQPIEGLRTACSEPNAILRLARTFRLLELFDALEFDSVLDVGGGEGYVSALIRDLHGPGVVHSTDLSAQACQRGRELFGIPGIAADITNLPIADGSYDVVVCSEVIEHLSAPILALSELARVARKFVIVSTAEFCPLGESERALRLRTLDASYPHAEVNWFTARDFITAFNGVMMTSQFRALEGPFPERGATREEVEASLARMTASFAMDVDHVGVIAVAPKPRVSPPAAATHTSAARQQQILNRLLDPPPGASKASGEDGLDSALLSRMRCPSCHASVLMEVAEALRCGACGRSYPLEAGVPAVFVEPVDDPAVADAHARSAIDRGIAQLAGGDAARARALRGLIGRLHHPARDHSRPVRWTASQLLRVLWLLRRDESAAVKCRRVLQRLGRKPQAAALAQPTGAAPVAGTPRRRADV